MTTHLNDEIECDECYECWTTKVRTENGNIKHLCGTCMSKFENDCIAMEIDYTILKSKD